MKSIASFGRAIFKYYYVRRTTLAGWKRDERGPKISFLSFARLLACLTCLHTTSVVWAEPCPCVCVCVCVYRTERLVGRIWKIFWNIFQKKGIVPVENNSRKFTLLVALEIPLRPTVSGFTDWCSGSSNKSPLAPLQVACNHCLLLNEVKMVKWWENHRSTTPRVRERAYDII